MNKVIGIFGTQGTGKTTYAIQYVKQNFDLYYSIWIFTPLLIQPGNDLFLINFKDFSLNEPRQYAIFKIFDIDRNLLLKYQNIQGKKLLVIDEVDLFFNIHSRKEDFILLTTLRNNDSDMLFISKRLKRIPLLLIQMMNKIVFFRYNLLRDLEEIVYEVPQLEKYLEKIATLKNFEYLEFER